MQEIDTHQTLGFVEPFFLTIEFVEPYESHNRLIAFLNSLLDLLHMS